jgi:hypothetical protein
VSDRKISVIRRELPYALMGTIIGVIAGWSLFLSTQKAEPTAIDPPAIASVAMIAQR